MRGSGGPLSLEGFRGESMADDSATGAQSESRRSAWGIGQLVVIAVVVLVAIYFARAPSGVSIDDGGRAATPAAPTVEVIQPRATTAAREVRTTGSVTVVGGVALGTQVAGEIVYVSPALRDGGSFMAGQTLVQIDREKFEIRLEAAEARLREMQARLQKQRLKGQAKRQQFLRENPGAEVPALVDRIPQIAKAQAKVDRAAALVKQAEFNLARTTISMPFDGWVRRSRIHVGQVAAQVRPLGQVFAKDAMRVEAQISHEDKEDLEPVIGHPAIAYVQGGRPFDVVVERVAAVVDRQSRQTTLHLAFTENTAIDERPRPGTFVNLVMESRPMDGVMVLPEAAEQANGSVWVVEDGKLAAHVPRALGRTSAGWLVEAFDVREGVVVGRVAQARAGLPVMPVDTAGARR